MTNYERWASEWPVTDADRARLLADIDASGLTVRQFAQEIGVSPHTLYAWRSRLRRRPSPRRDERVELIEVDLPVRTEASHEPFAEVVLNDGVVVRVVAGFDARDLEELLRVVRRSC